MLYYLMLRLYIWLCYRQRKVVFQNIGLKWVFSLFAMLQHFFLKMSVFEKKNLVAPTYGIYCFVAIHFYIKIKLLQAWQRWVATKNCDQFQLFIIFSKQALQWSDVFFCHNLDVIFAASYLEEIILLYFWKMKETHNLKQSWRNKRNLFRQNIFS